MKADDVTIRIRAKDEVSPVLRRIGRQLWWFRYGGAVLFAASLLLMALITVLAFVIGRITA